MLHKDKVLNMQSSSYDKFGLLSSRSVDLFMGVREIGKEGCDYIANKVGEVLTGVSSEKIFGFSEQYDWQIGTEPEAITEFAEVQKSGQYIIHFPVISDGTVFIAEPSALWLRGLNQKNADEYIVEPIMCKCPREFAQFIGYTAVNSPQELKKSYPKYYWRMLDNMLVCNAIKGYFFVFHPLFDQGTRHHTILFDRLSLLGDLNHLKERKAEAAELYKATMVRMTNKS